MSKGHPSSSPSSSLVGQGDKKCTQLPLLEKHVLSQGQAAGSARGGLGGWGAGRHLPVTVGRFQVEVDWGGNSEHKGWWGGTSGEW